MVELQMTRMVDATYVRVRGPDKSKVDELAAAVRAGLDEADVWYGEREGTGHGSMGHVYWTSFDVAEAPK